jgi:hypothetical protein
MGPTKTSSAFSNELMKSLNDKFHYGVVSSFGPQTELASMLLAKGQKDAVITYLKTAIIIEKEDKTRTQIKCALKEVQNGKNPFEKLYSPNFWFKICSALFNKNFQNGFYITSFISCFRSLKSFSY